MSAPPALGALVTFRPARNQERAAIARHGRAWAVLDTCQSFAGPTFAGLPCALLGPPGLTGAALVEAWRWVPLDRLGPPVAPVAPVTWRPEDFAPAPVMAPPADPWEG